MKQLCKSKRGEMFVDVAVMILCSVMIIVLALNTFRFFAIKQDLDYYAKEMIRSATVEGRINATATLMRRDRLSKETGLHPSITWNANYFNSTQRTVQLGDTIEVTLTYQTTFEGFGIFSMPVTLTAKHSGLSQRYWK